MHFHQNHCWCSQSNWTGGMFDATYMVSIEKWPDYDVNVPHNKQIVDADWSAVIQEVPFMSQAEYDRNVAVFGRMSDQGHHIDMTEDQLRECSMRVAPDLKPEVYEWLYDTVAPVKYPARPQGWCIGNQDYRYSGSTGELTIWFRRRRNAMAFIRRWSRHKKPTSYLNYFRDDYRKLVNGRLVKVERG